MVLMCSSALKLPLMDGRSDSGMGLRRSSGCVTRRVPTCSACVTAERGLDPVLGFPLGLKAAACGLGRNSLLFGFNRAVCALELERRESIGLEGPVGGSLCSGFGIGFVCAAPFCSTCLSRALKLPGCRFGWIGMAC